MARIGYRVLTTDGDILASFAEVVAAVCPLLVKEGELLSAWLEHPLLPDGMVVEDAAVDGVTAQGLLEHWTEGRIFGTRGELRWEVLFPNGVHVVVISDSEDAEHVLTTTAFEDVYLLRVVDEEERAFLWGTWSEAKGWSEDRIPNLRYPPAWKGPYAVVRLRSYELPSTKEREYDSHIVRYVSYDGNVVIREDDGR